MTDTQDIEVIDAAAVEIADVVFGTTHAYFKNNTTSLVRTLNKVPTVTSPTKQKISGAIYFKNLPYYEMKYIGDDDNIKYIEFGSINKPITRGFIEFSGIYSLCICDFSQLGDFA